MQARRIEYVALSTVQGAKRNPKLHAKEAIATSIRRHGFVELPVIDERTGRLVAGHGRVDDLATKKAAGQPAPAGVRVEHDDWFVPVVRGWSSESDAQAEAYLVASNRTTEMGGWDTESLASLLDDVRGAGELEASAYSAKELDRMLAAMEKPLEGLIDPNSPAEPEAPELRAKTGELWRLGDHRLLVGDSTNREDVARLFAVGGRGRASCLWTDPPYGVNYEGKSKVHSQGKIGNDTPEAAIEVASAALRNAMDVLTEGAPFYIAHPAGPLGIEFLAAIKRLGWRYRQALVWDKGVMVLGHSDYHYAHEPIAYGYLPGAGRPGRGGDVGWYGDNSQTTVFRIPKPAVSAEHPTMKPVELVEAMVHNSTRKGDLVYEPFAGSGTTIIACERLGRTCFAIERDPVFASRIIARYEAFLGVVAELDPGSGVEIRRRKTSDA